MARAYPINSSADAVSLPGVNDFDLLRFPTEFLEEGVVRGFAVTQRGAGANMSVDVAAGFALIEITNTNVEHGRTYKTWFEETVTTNVVVTTADATNARKDRLVLRVDVSTDPNTAASNIAIIELLAGTPAPSPSAPAEPSNAITLAIIDIPAGDTSITTGQITDSRTYVTTKTAVLVDLLRKADAGSTANGKGASLISIEDADGNLTATNVETALAELIDLIDAASTVPGIYGDASDGNVTLGSNTTMTKDMHYDTLDLAGHTLNTAGYKVFARRVTDSSGGGKIKAPTGSAGGNGGNASGTTAGTAGTAGSGTTGNTLPDSDAGKAGGAGGNGLSAGSGNNAGSNGTTGASVTNSLGSTSGASSSAGGAGGNSSDGGAPTAGGAGGTSAGGTATQTNGRKSYIEYERFISNKGTTFTAFSGCGGAGGAGGGGSGSRTNTTGTFSSGAGGGGGGSGGNGGYWFVSVFQMDGNWTIEALGGAGGNGGNGSNATGTPTGNGGAGAGGGGAAGSGGSGGSGVLIYNVRTSWTGSLVLTGGAAGSVGTGGSTGVSGGSGVGGAGSNGGAGSVGASGIAIQIQI